jgi:hypothetical protein
MMHTTDTRTSRAKNFSHLSGAIALALSAVHVAGAQTAPAKVVTRQLAAPTATSEEILGSLAAVRQLPNGNVLVNDQARRRVVMLDPNLKLVSVVADSTASTASAYGVRPGGLLAYRGDSTLFVDPASLSMLVIDPSGKITRVMAAPRPNDVQFLATNALGNPGFDAQGRLVYRIVDMSAMMRGMRPPEPGKPFVPPTPPDSSALVRFDLSARKLDTVGFFKTAKVSMTMSQDANGGMRIMNTINPLPVVDEWAVMSDGTIAFLRGKDYHVDFVAADGTKRAAEKIPYEWQRLTDDDKTRFIDSARVAIEKSRAAGPAAAQGGAAPMVPFGDGGGQRQMITMTQSGPAGTPPKVDMAVGGAPPAGGMPPVAMVSPSELPDYKPVFSNGSVRADMDGRIWVRTIPTKPTPGGAIYDVIDTRGQLVDRVQVPVGTTIAGFGAGGVVYLGIRDATGIHVLRATSR